MSKSMRKSQETMERLKIDTVMLGKHFFSGSETGKHYLLTGEVKSTRHAAKIDMSGV